MFMLIRSRLKPAGARRVCFALSGADDCGETLSYALLSLPAHGMVTNATGQATNPNYIYTPSGTNFTGLDSFNYLIFSECGDSATGTVSITVGDANLYPIAQSVMTRADRPVAITLSAMDYDSCAEAGDYLYTISSPAHGTLSNTPPISPTGPA